MEHTPKNILIRAVRGQAGQTEALWSEYTAFRDFIQADPYLERACADLLPGAGGNKPGKITEDEESGKRKPEAGSCDHC